MKHEKIEVQIQVGNEGTIVRMSPESAMAHNQAHPTGPVTEHSMQVELSDGTIIRVPQGRIDQVLSDLGRK